MNSVLRLGTKNRRRADCVARRSPSSPIDRTAWHQARRLEHAISTRTRGGIVALLFVVASVVVALVLQPHAAPPADPLPQLAKSAATSFLHQYVNPSGRVVRHGQGGDTVSEGQAYGLLLAVATGNEGQFASIWNWTRTHLQQPDLLLAWHWSHGALLSTTPATDADVNTAWALVLAGQRFHNPGWAGAGVAMANAVLANETVAVTTAPQTSAPILIAGTWAKGPPAIVNPSYFSPRAEAALAQATRNPAWSAMAAAQTQLLHRLLAAAPLPPAWTTVQSTGTITPIGGPSNPGATPDYGLNAQRIPVQLAAGPSTDRQLAASLWNTIKTLPQGGSQIRYSLSGTSLSSAVNPLGLVATAAAAGAAGHRNTEIAALAQATRLAQRYPSYYGNAWVALGRILLTTPWLGTG